MTCARSVLSSRRFAVLLLSAAQAVVVSAQDDSASRAPDSVARRRIQPLPALGSAPETGLQFGANLLAVWVPPAVHKTRPTSLNASALRTAESQTRVRIDGERWTRGNARRVAGGILWQEFPLPYYGIGDQAQLSDKETYTPRGTEASLTLQQRFSGAWYASAGVRHVNQRITTDSSGRLRTALVPGTRGGALTEWSAGVLTDTRDNLFAPRDGRWVQLSYGRSVRGVWSDYNYGTLRLDARRYRELFTNHVIAAQVQVVSVDGGAPFDQLALVGNTDILRGYARGRYRDRAMAAAQLEYRTPVSHRLGAVVFAGAGSLAPGLASLHTHRLLPSYGAGLRLQLDRRLRSGVRVDYGFGSQGARGLYLGFNQAF